MATAAMIRKRKRQPIQHTISIEVLDGRFTYRDQDTILARGKHAHHEDQVGWESKTGEDFTIAFVEWPFAGRLKVLKSKNRKVSPLQVHPNAKEDYEYKYTVSMLSSGLSDDPDIIIDPCNAEG
jgi:hypothetical protein